VLCGLRRQQREIGGDAEPRSRPAAQHLGSAPEAVESAFAALAELKARRTLNRPFSEWNGSFALITISPEPPPDEESKPETQLANLEPPRVEAPLPASRALISRIPNGSGPETKIAEPVQEQRSAIFSFFDRLVHSGSKETPSIPPEATGRTAVYDIQARTLYLPSGVTLEAHPDWATSWMTSAM
jgi:hypothetical protein